MRYSYLVALIGTICSDRAIAAVAVGRSIPGRQLQDQTICDQLKDGIQQNTTTMDIQGSCACSTISGGNVRLSCQRNDVCISSDGGDPMQGDFSATYTKDLNSLSYSQTVTSETCFTYPTDVYDGKKVCVTYVDDGMGTVSTCEIQVGSDTCNVCRFCPIDLISFDCSNLGYEERTACSDNNTDDSILQFLYMPEIATGCSPSSGSSTQTSGGASVVNTMMAASFGVVSLLWMG